MSFTFRRAVRENVPLILGLGGGTGSGKTMSAMKIATGLSGGKPFAVIDSEPGRAKAYAADFVFDHGDLAPPFSPDHYLEAILAADAAGYPVIVVDSFSHEHAGEGGLLEMHDQELDRMAGTDWSKRAACTMAAWIKPKVAHKHMVQRLLQLRAHLILCFRAEEKVEIVKENGKTLIVPKQTKTGLDGWSLIAEKNLPYELTASFLLNADSPGVPRPIKLQQQHRAFFPASEVITEECGRRLAAWASGASAVDYARAIANAPTLDALAAIWKAIPRSEVSRFTAAKDARKRELDAPPHDATTGEVTDVNTVLASAVKAATPVVEPKAKASKEAPKQTYASLKKAVDDAAAKNVEAMDVAMALIDVAVANRDLTANDETKIREYFKGLMEERFA